MYIFLNLYFNIKIYFLKSLLIMLFALVVNCKIRETTVSLCVSPDLFSHANDQNNFSNNVQKKEYDSLSIIIAVDLPQ